MMISSKSGNRLENMIKKCFPYLFLLIVHFYLKVLRFIPCFQTLTSGNAEVGEQTRLRRLRIVDDRRYCDRNGTRSGPCYLAASEKGRSRAAFLYQRMIALRSSSSIKDTLAGGMATDTPACR